MKKKQTEIIISVALAVVLVLSILPLIKAGKARDAPKALSATHQNAVSGAFLKSRMADKALADKHDSLTWGRNPFVLEEIAPAEVNSTSNMKLMGIIMGADSKPKAIINNEIYPVGSKIGPFTIKNIFKAKVVVSDGEKDYDLNLY